MLKSVKFSSSPELSYSISDLLRSIDQGFRFFEIELVSQSDKLATIFSNDSRSKVELKTLLTLMKPKMFENSPLPVLFYFTTTTEKPPVSKIAEVMIDVFGHRLFVYEEIASKNYPLILMKNFVILANSIDTDARSLREFLATIPSNAGSIRNISKPNNNEPLDNYNSRKSIDRVDSARRPFKICDSQSKRLTVTDPVKILYLASQSTILANPKNPSGEKDAPLSKIQQNSFEQSQAPTLSQFKTLAVSIHKRVNACPIEWTYHKDRLFAMAYSKVFERKWGNQLGYVSYSKTPNKESRTIGVVPLFVILPILTNGNVKIKAYQLNESSDNLTPIKKTQVFIENNFARFFEIDPVNSKPIIRSDSELILPKTQDSLHLLYFVIEVFETGQLYFALIDLRATQKNFKLARIFSFTDMPKLSGLIFFNVSYK